MSRTRGETQTEYDNRLLRLQTEFKERLEEILKKITNTKKPKKSLKQSLKIAQKLLQHLQNEFEKNAENINNYTYKQKLEKVALLDYALKLEKIVSDLNTKKIDHNNHNEFELTLPTTITIGGIAYQVTKEIAKSNGTVFLCTAPGGKQFVLKRSVVPVHTSDTSSIFPLGGYINENNYLNKLGDVQSIVKYYNHTYSMNKDSDMIYVHTILEYCEGVTLDKKYKNISIEERKRLLTSDTVPQILNALAIMHDSNIVHRDLKPDNIMISNQAQATLIDFGCSTENSVFNRLKKLEYQDALTKMIKNVDWMFKSYNYSEGYSDPNNESKNTEKDSDMYSFGCILFLMFTGEDHRNLIIGKDDSGDLEKRKQDQRQYEVTNLSKAQKNLNVSNSKEIVNLILDLLAWDRTTRPHVKNTLDRYKKWQNDNSKKEAKRLDSAATPTEKLPPSSSR